MHPELGELKFNEYVWDSATQTKVVLWNRAYDVRFSFYVRNEEEPNANQEDAYQKFKSIVAEQRDTIEKMIMEYEDEKDIEKAGNRFIPYEVQISHGGECALVFGDAELYKQVYGDTEERYFDFETGFAMFLIPRLVYYGAEECFDFMIRPDDEITLDELYGRETVFEKNSKIKFRWEGDDRR